MMSNMAKLVWNTNKAMYSDDVAYTVRPREQSVVIGPGCTMARRLPVDGERKES